MGRRCCCGTTSDCAGACTIFCDNFSDSFIDATDWTLIGSSWSEHDDALYITNSSTDFAFALVQDIVAPEIPYVIKTQCQLDNTSTAPMIIWNYVDSSNFNYLVIEFTTGWRGVVGYYDGDWNDINNVFFDGTSGLADVILCVGESYTRALINTEPMVSKIETVWGLRDIGVATYGEKHAIFNHFYVEYYYSDEHSTCETCGGLLQGDCVCVNGLCATGSYGWNPCPTGITNVGSIYAEYHFVDSVECTGTCNQRQDALAYCSIYCTGTMQISYSILGNVETHDPSMDTSAIYLDDVEKVRIGSSKTIHEDVCTMEDTSGSLTETISAGLHHIKFTADTVDEQWHHNMIHSFLVEISEI